MTRACNPGGGIKLLVGIGLWSFQTCASLGPKIKGVFLRIVGFCRTEGAMLKCVYWTRAQRSKDPSVLGHSFLCAGWEASILLAYQSNESPLEAHQVSRAPLVHRVGHVALLPLPTISFSYCSNSCSFFFFPVICCYILPLFELPIIWFSFSLVLFFFLFSFFPVICSFLFLLELPESVICKNQ